MSATTPGVRRAGADGRFDALAQQVRTIRGRRTGRTDIWMLYVGGSLMPLGGLLIVLGWLGASRTPFVFEQTPYLISGGLLGLGLVIGGGFVYFGYWQSLRIRESRRQNEDLTAAVARLEALLGNGNAAGVGAARFVATAQGSIFHRPDCAVVTGKSGLRTVSADDPGLQPCKLCDPLGTAM